jgi:hypothetical protein
MPANLLEVLLAAFGGSAVALLVVGFLGRSLVGHWLQRALKDYDAQLAARVRIIELQLPAYRELWELSSSFRSSFAGEYDADVMRAGERRLSRWYYHGGNGALLSFEAQSILQAGLSLLRRCAPADSAAITRIFSRLRTQLKRDLGIYSETEAARQLDSQQVIEQARAEAAAAGTAARR